MISRTLFPLVFILFFGFQEAQAQSDDESTKIAALIKNADAKELAKYFNISVQLILPDNEGRYSQTQAEFIIKDFFKKYPPRSFVINHQGSSSDGSLYCIGVYKSESRVFRSYFLLKQVSEKALIHQMRFEDDN